MADVVIVGAGVGGLSAAVALASRGLDVELFEAASRVGGKVDVVEIDGVEMDTGPSLLTLPDILDRVLRRSGSSLEEELELVVASPPFRYHFPDGARLDVHFELEDTLAATRASLGVEAARQLERFLAYARDIWEASRDDFVLRPPPRVRELPRLLARRPLAALRVDPFRTMAAAIRERVKEPHLAAVLLRYATYSGSSAFRAPATLNCIAHVEMGLGMFGVRGGMAEIARALRGRAEARGAQVRTGCGVERILLAGGRAVGVELADGRARLARAVVVNADVAHLAERLLPGARGFTSTPANVSLSAVCALVKARRRRDRAAHEVWLPRDYRAEMEDLFEQGAPPREPTLYVCAQEKAHRRRGWGDHEPLFVMANAPAEPKTTSRAHEARVASLRRAIRSGLIARGVVDEDDEIVWERLPRDLAARFPGTRGAIYGAASHGWRSAFQRPGNRVDEVPGLYLAGGSVHPGAGVPLCLQSGLIAADLVAQDLGVDRRE